MEQATRARAKSLKQYPYCSGVEAKILAVTITFLHSLEVVFRRLEEMNTLADRNSPRRDLNTWEGEHLK
jgi:hypothetical protein